VLGDFGIVFWADDESRRLTETYERVGSRDWMAPWANRGRRLADINATFDVFPLAKLLWAMVSGQDELPYWYWQAPEHNLERLFPDDEGMYWINSQILNAAIVEYQEHCITSASELRARVRAVIGVIERGGQRVTATRRPCRVCGVGHYQDPTKAPLKMVAMVDPKRAGGYIQTELLYQQSENRLTLKPLMCDACGHVDFFHFNNSEPPPLWKPEPQ